MRHRSSGSQPLALPFGRRFFHLKGDSVGNCVIRWCKIQLDRGWSIVGERPLAKFQLDEHRERVVMDVRLWLRNRRIARWLSLEGKEQLRGSFQPHEFADEADTRCARTTCTSRREVIHYERIRRKGRVTFFHVTLRCRENEVWKFIKYAWTWLIPDWTEINNRQDVIVRVKIGGKCRRTFFREKNPLFLRKINPTAYYTRILGQFLVRHVQTPSSWKRKLRTRVFSLLRISYSVFIFPTFFLSFFLFPLSNKNRRVRRRFAQTIWYFRSRRLMKYILCV